MRVKPERTPQSPVTPTGSGIGGVTDAKNAALSRKVTKLLDITADDSFNELVQYTEETCPEVLTVEGSEARKLLRPALDSRLIQLHRTFLEEFRHVRNAYKDVCGTIDSLKKTTDAVHTQLAQSRKQSAGLMEAVDTLRAERDVIRKKEEQMKTFMAKYNLTPEEATAIRTGSIDENYITILGKVQSIHKSCRQLLSVENQQAAVEIMESMYVTYMAATDRLTKYLLTSSSNVMVPDFPDLTDFYVSCVRTLSDRPAQWTRVMSEIARVRKTAVLRKFFDVQTKGSGGRSSKPLDEYANDPVRFFGDLFAWIHQCIAEEEDLLSCFFDHQPSTPTSPMNPEAASLGTEGEGSGSITKSDILDQVFEILVRHIHTRFESALQMLRKRASQSNTSGAVLVAYFKLEGIFSFYAVTTDKLLGENSALARMFSTERLEVMRVFFDLLKTAGSRMFVAGRIPHNLSVPQDVVELLGVLTAMMDTMSTSVVPHDQRETEFAPVLGALIDPIPSLSNTVDGVGGPLNRCVLRINTLSAVETALTGYPFTAQKRGRVTHMLQEDCDMFCNDTTEQVFLKLGFTDALRKLSSAEEVNVEELQSTLHSFCSVVYNSGAVSIPLLDNIQHIRIRDTLSSRISRNVCDAYEKVYDAVKRNLSSDEDEVGTKELTFHSPQQIRVLLDVA